MSSILVIEDNDHINSSICEILVHQNYAVNSAENGVVGVEMAQDILPDLVICDLVMPKMNGWKTLEYFRKSDRLRYIPFIFISDFNSFRRKMDMGADDYLQKPFSGDELLEKVSLQLEKIEQRKRKIAMVESGMVQKRKDTNERTIYGNNNMEQQLNTAKQIQQVILSNNEVWDRLFPKHFKFFLPKYPVSGDFFWLREIDNLTMVAVADCTGHGIPAAFITISCYYALNQAVDRNKLISPAQILKKVNTLIVEYLGGGHTYSEEKGMDISLCVIDGTNNTITYAGAKRPLYLVSENIDPVSATEHGVIFYESNSNRSLFKIKGSMHSIGSAERGFEICDQTFRYNSGDTIYLSSDGYVDQFGGEEDKKFKTTPLINLLLSIQDKSMDEQKDIVANAFEEWKGDEEQTDDVTLIGIQL